MRNSDDIYVKYADENGDEYYCPINVIEDGYDEESHLLDDCVEASTVGRYSGNLNVKSQSSI